MPKERPNEGDQIERHDETKTEKNELTEGGVNTPKQSATIVEGPEKADEVRATDMITEGQVDDPSSSNMMQQKSTTEKTNVDTEDKAKETPANEDLKFQEMKDEEEKVEEKKI